MKREKTLLRSNAALAKRRLVSGFWNQKHEKHNLENINNPDAKEEQFYRSVASILGAGDSNPLATLLDQEHMSTLDDAARQRYVLGMSELVNKSIERYNRVC